MMESMVCGDDGMYVGAEVAWRAGIILRCCFLGDSYTVLPISRLNLVYYLSLWLI